MITLQRLTTEYIDGEDRIRLAGESGEGGTLTLWLTRRLLDRLIPHLTLWLEKQQENLPHADLLLGFAQQKAQAGLVPQPPVKAAPDDTGWLVRELDICPGSEHLQLTFKGAPEQAAAIGFSSLALRQWLGILYTAYTLGDWPTAAWPEWMHEGRADSAMPAAALH